MTEAWIAHSPFLVNGMGSHLLATEALQRVDREMSNVGLASLAAHRKMVAAGLPARSTVANIATGLPAQSTIARDVPMAASPHYPAELDLGDDPPIAPRPRPFFHPAPSHRSSPQMSPSPLNLPGLPPSQSPASNASMLFTQSPNYSPKSLAADTSPATEVSQGLRRSARAATIAASSMVCRVLMLSPVQS